MKAHPIDRDTWRAVAALAAALVAVSGLGLVLLFGCSGKSEICDGSWQPIGIAFWCDGTCENDEDCDAYAEAHAVGCTNCACGAEANLAPDEDGGAL
jgi:hypothetical protein